MAIEAEDGGVDKEAFEAVFVEDEKVGVGGSGEADDFPFLEVKVLGFKESPKRRKKRERRRGGRRRHGNGRRGRKAVGNQGIGLGYSGDRRSLAGNGRRVIGGAVQSEESIVVGLGGGEFGVNKGEAGAFVEKKAVVPGERRCTFFPEQDGSDPVI